MKYSRDERMPIIRPLKTFKNPKKESEPIIFGYKNGEEIPNLKIPENYISRFNSNISETFKNNF
jgi:hypothetical protein